MPNNLELGTRECEVKFALTDIEKVTVIKTILKENSFIAAPEQLETDFLPDTEDFLCRQNNLLLRFRRVRNQTKNDILLTLKIGKTNKEGFQDARELEYYFSNIDYNLFKAINTILEQATNHTLPEAIHSFHDFRQLQSFLSTVGFPALRIFIEKKRTQFSKGTNHVTFDTFPKDIGTYLEIETRTPEELDNMIALLQLPKDQLELRDYGDIVKDAQRELPEMQRRTALFE